MIKYLLCLFVIASPLVAQAERIDDLLNYSKKRDDALVVKVVNADVLVLENGQRVKLIGVESIGQPPRKYVRYDSSGKPIEEEPTDEMLLPSIEEQAIAYAEDLLEEKKVKLEYDIEGRSPEGYLYAYVYLPNGQMANTELLRMGFVRLQIVPPNLKYADKLREAYKEAKTEKRGVESES